MDTMTKRYALPLALALLGGPVVGQQNGSFSARKAVHPGKTMSATHIPTRLADPAGRTPVERAAFYTEDFSGGALPAGWTNVDELTPQTDDPVFFEWSDDPTAVDAASGSFPEIGVFNASGASNGYIWANSDRGLTTAPASEHLTKLTTNAIDCSGQPTVMLSMQSTLGVFNNNANQFCKVKVSTNGTDWTEFLPFPCLVAGDPTPPCSRFSANPQEVLLNITSVAANQPTVFVQFEWQGDWEYYWAIDDLQLSPLPDYEIIMDLGYVSTTGNGEEYGRVLTTQLPATLNVGAVVINFGAATQTNIIVDHVVTDEDGNEVLSDTAGVSMLASSDTVTTDKDPDLPELATGLYTVDYSLTSDQVAQDLDPTNNSKVRTFAVTQDTYSLDGIGLHPEGTETLEQIGSGSFADNTENVKLLNYYEIYNTLTVTGVEIALGPATETGSSIFISILDTADVLATPSVVNEPLTQSSDPHVITAADSIAGVVGIPFDAPFSLSPGGYFVVASLFQGDGEADVFVLDDTTIPQPNIASALWIPFDPPTNQNLYGGNGTAWAIRLSTNTGIGVEENHELDAVSIYPNPANGILHISTTTNETYTAEVMNMLGESLLTMKFTGMTTLDLERFADGIYNVRISNGTSTTVRRVTLN
ncbi:MAG: T9SS type A sorting domain-containing protein [Flavobacteriales bacterium]|nr:T9SS type A sorting domain-containing protein [Flavobacteriales bacterium]